jgi:hypothetical protein
MINGIQVGGRVAHRSAPADQISGRRLTA